MVCEYDASDDFSGSDDLLESARRVLGRIPRNSSDTYTFLGHHFHYTSGSGDRDDDLNYVCVAGQEAGVDLPFKFLREVKSKCVFYNSFHFSVVVFQHYQVFSNIIILLQFHS